MEKHCLIIGPAAAFAATVRVLALLTWGAPLFAAGQPAASDKTSTDGTNAIPNQTVRLPKVTVEEKALPAATGVSQTISGDQVRSGGVTSTRELTATTPNLAAFDANNDRIPKYSIRGLRENNFSTGEPVLAMYVDDAPYMEMNSRGVPLYDVDRLEFARGPQGFSLGANGPGGAILAYSRPPGNEWTGHAGFGYGNYNSQNFEGGLRGPLLTNQLSFGLAGIYARRDGFVRNDFNGRDPDSKDTLAGRAQVRWTPAPALDLQFTATAERFNDGFVPTYYPGHDARPFHVSRDVDGYVKTESFSQSLRVAYDAQAVKVTSISSHRAWSQDLLQDFDFSSSKIRDGFSRPDLEAWSQEIRLQSPDNNERLKWQAGLFFSDQDLQGNSGSTEYLSISSLSPLPPPYTFRTSYKTGAQTYALYGQATYTAWEKLDLTAGVRLSYDDRRMWRKRVLENAYLPDTTLGAADESAQFPSAQPKFGLAYRFNDQFKAYVDVASSFQSGGFNTSNDDAAQTRFEPARSWHYEAGVKSDWFDKKLSANLALFHIQTHNYQVFRFDSIDPSKAYLLNAEEVSHWGGEFELKARPVEGLELSGSVGLTQATFDKFNDRRNGLSFDGKGVDFVPKFTASVAAQYRLPRNFYARIELQGVGDYYFDQSNSTRQGAYVLLNAKVGYELKHFEIYAFGKNLTDQQYFNNALDLRWAYEKDKLILQTGDPLTFGIAANLKF